jgi:hypothetical protein
VKPHEAAVKEFEEADKALKELQEKLTSGEIITEIYVEDDAVAMQQQFCAFLTALQNAIERRNNAIKAAADELRPLVMIDPSKERGVDGKPTLLASGPFKASSVTSRYYDQKELFALCQQHGVLERLLELKTLDKDGKEKKLVEMSYDIDFDGVTQWLRGNKLDAVMTRAYGEKEKTPMVKGPKPVIFLGETKEK